MPLQCWRVVRASEAERGDTRWVPTYQDDAIVLRTHLLGEADRIVTLLCKTRGKVRAVAKGVRKTTSRFGSRLQPFNVVDLSLYEGKSLDIVQNADTIASYSEAISHDYPRYTAAMVMVETADRLTDHDFQPSHYMLLQGGLRSLASGEHEPGISVDSYLLRALAIAGWAPSLDECAVTGEAGDHRAFVVSLGGVVADEVAPAGSPRLGEGTKEFLVALLQGDWPVVESAPAKNKQEASGLIAAHTQYHLERHVKSLAHLDRSGAEVAS
jgi:DNA repair protein RecO (recombination protein O)